MNHVEHLDGTIAVHVSEQHTIHTDALLLASFSCPRPHDIACDMGTGCGVIPLAWCRNPEPEYITAVEIQADACRLLEQSIEDNHLNHRITVVRADIRTIADVLPAGQHSLVTMNPPYFAPNTGKIGTDFSRSICRSEISCTITDVAYAASYLLKNGGRFCLCYRPQRLCDALCALRANNLEPKKLRLVRKTPDHSPSLALIEARKQGGISLEIQPDLIWQSEEWKQICKE